MSQINQTNHYNFIQKQPAFNADSRVMASLPQNVQAANIQIPEAAPEVQLPVYYQDTGNFNKPITFKEVLKKADFFGMVYPWLDTPLLMAGTTAATVYGIDKFTNAWSGEYETSLLGKANKLGDNIVNAKIFKKEPVKKVLDTINSGYNKVSKAINKNSWVRAMKDTPCQAEWSWGKIETISQNRRIIQDDFLKIVDTLGLANEKPIALKEIGLKKCDEDLLKRIFKVADIKSIPEEEAVNAVLLGRLGKADTEVLNIAKQGKSGLKSVKKELLDFIGLSADDIGKIKLDEADELVSKVFDAAKKGKGKIWVGEGEIGLLGKFQPLKRYIGMDNVFNRMHSIADGAKTKLGKGFSQFIQQVYRGFTFGGGKGGMILFIVPHLAKAITDTIKAEPEEKVSTAVQGGIGAISWAFTMPIATKMLYSMGGLKYAGMGKEKVTTFRKLVNEFNEAAVNYDKATYNTERKILMDKLKNLKKVDGQNLLTKWARSIADFFTSDLGMIQPHKDSIFGKLGKGLKNAGNIPVRFISAMVLMGVLDGIITKVLSGIFGRAHNEDIIKEHKEEKENQKRYTKEDLHARLLQAQQNKVLGVNQPQKTEQMIIPEHAKNNNPVEEPVEEYTPIPGQENKFKLPQEQAKNNSGNKIEKEHVNQDSYTYIPTSVPYQENNANTAQNLDNYTYIPNEQAYQEVGHTSKNTDNYTYIPSENPFKDTQAEEVKKNDSYTYIPSAENVLKKEEKINGQYIPSQMGTQVVKTFDNSAIQAAFLRADKAEQKAIEILNGKFPGI